MKLNLSRLDMKKKTWCKRHSFVLLLWLKAADLKLFDPV